MSEHGKQQPVLDTRRLEIHTSDRNLFLRCRRKWNWQSILRQGLQTKGSIPTPLWFGSGFHFAMEDYHGYQKFNTPFEAFEAYAKAFPAAKRPQEVEELLELAEGMLEHYVKWEERREKLTTMWVPPEDVPTEDGVTHNALRPLVELDWRLPIPGLLNARGEQVYAAGTFDRVVQDESGRLWIVDYKTAASFNTAKLAFTPQILNYTWAATEIFGQHFEGCIWQTHLKAVPEPPERLKNGGLSVNKQQRTTFSMYRSALKSLVYPNLAYEQWDPKYHEFLEYLASLEQTDSDRFIRRDFIRCNEAQIASEIRNLYAIASDMLNPDIPIYPNFTADCAWDCPFQSACTALEDDADPESILSSNFEPIQEWHEWRKNIRYPETATKTSHFDVE